MLKITEYMKKYGHEQLVFCSDPQVNLNAVIAIHDTSLGPALGGARMWLYQSEDEAILDVLRLARAMSYKNSAAGLNLGGGKAAIIGDPSRDKNTGLFRSLGRFIESLGGRYITTEDVGTTVEDMQQIRAETKHVTGLPLAWGGSGDPSVMTGYGIYLAMRVCARDVFGVESLRGKTVALQGFGKVGFYLAGHLRDEGARIIATDISEASARRARDEFDATLVSPDDIYDVECDIFSPCALGAVLNRRTIPRLKSRLVCGGANNQLEEDEDGDLLEQRGILYAPDYIVNAGGVINLSLELTGYNAKAAKAQVAGIRNTMEKVIALARSQKISTAKAADRLASSRIDEARKVRTMYLEK